MLVLTSSLQCNHASSTLQHASHRRGTARCTQQTCTQSSQLCAFHPRTPAAFSDFTSQQYSCACVVTLVQTTRDHATSVSQSTHHLVLPLVLGKQENTVRPTKAYALSPSLELPSSGTRAICSFEDVTCSSITLRRRGGGAAE